jgi:hypothetical protein
VPPHFAKGERESARVAPTRDEEAGAKRRRRSRVRMPLIYRRDSARQGSGAGRARALEERGIPMPRRVAIDDVLIDSMRGRSSTWTASA